MLIFLEALIKKSLIDKIVFALIHLGFKIVNRKS